METSPQANGVMPLESNRKREVTANPMSPTREFGTGDVELVNRPDADDNLDPLRRTQTHLEQINANQQFRDVAKFFEAILYLHLVPQLLKHPDLFSGPGIPGDPFGRSFLERVVRTLEKTRRSRLRKIESALLLAVPQIKGLTDVTDESGTPHLEAVYTHWRPTGAKQREDRVLRRNTPSYWTVVVAARRRFFTFVGGA